MTSSIPDGISFSDLQKLADQAPDEQKKETSVYGKQKLTEEELIDLVDKAFKASFELCGDPMMNKLLMMRMAHHYIEWHTQVAGRMAEEGSTAGAVNWLRDAGKFQSIMDILRAINMGPGDFVTPE